MLRVKKLSKLMPGFILEADFDIQSSERLALTGRSGVGKTTLLRLIAGLDEMSPLTDAGEIVLENRVINRVPVQKREIGFVFQDQALFSGRSVFENIAFGLKVRGVTPERQKLRVEEWLEKFDLKRRGEEKVDHLSGGERQRVALARALITQPRLLLMDEPFVGLDSALRMQLFEELISLHEENPIPLLFVSHDSEDLTRLATGKLSFDESDLSQNRRVVRRDSISF